MQYWSVRSPEPIFGTHVLLFCMRIVATVQIWVRVRVIVGLCKFINTSVPAKKLTNKSQYAMLVRPSDYICIYYTLDITCSIGKIEYVLYTHTNVSNSGCITYGSILFPMHLRLDNYLYVLKYK